MAKDMNSHSSKDKMQMAIEIKKEAEAHKSSENCE